MFDTTVSPVEFGLMHRLALRETPVPVVLRHTDVNTPARAGDCGRADACARQGRTISAV